MDSAEMDGRLGHSPHLQILCNLPTNLHCVSSKL
jgi:hypothetical protein